VTVEEEGDKKIIWWRIGWLTDEYSVKKLFLNFAFITNQFG